MFKITIEGETLAELAQRLSAMATQFATTSPEEPKPATRRKAPKPEPEAEPETGDEFDADAEEAEPAQPMPEGAKQLVDAGTGKPAGETTVKQMTFDDVKVAAAKLSAKDTPKLAEILKGYGAAKLSEVPKDKLGDFAGDVMEALG